MKRNSYTLRLFICCLFSLTFIGLLLWLTPLPPSAGANTSASTSASSASGAQTCTFTINPASRNFEAGGGSSGVAVAASAPSCAWNASSSLNWVNLTSGASGTGNGVVAFSVAANTGAARTGTITIAGQTFTFNQSAASGPAGLQYYPLAFPVRVLDTRPDPFPSCFDSSTPLTGGSVFTLPVVGNCNGLTIPASAKAVVGNATVVNFQSGGGFITLFPSDAPLPNASNLNFTANHIVPNSFTVGLGSDGAIKIFTSASTNFIVDITGYYAPPGAGGLYFHPLAFPVRMLDTRPDPFTSCVPSSTPLVGGGTLTLPVVGDCNGLTIPASAKALVGNATVVNFQSGGGFMTLFPSDATLPNASNLNFTSNHIVPNSFVVGLGPDGAFKIFTSASTNFIVDITGYFSDQAVDVNGQGLLLTPLSAPARWLDTRPDPFVSCIPSSTPFGAGSITMLQAQMTCEGQVVPANAKSVLGNATVVNFQSGGGFITLFPSDATLPNASNLNFTASHIVPNSFVVGLGGDGALKIFTSAATNFIVDLSGYFAPPPTPPPLPSFFNGPLIFNTQIENPLNPSCGCAPLSGQGCPSAEAAGVATGISQDAGGGMILLHSGEFIQRKAVLAIPGRGLNWNFALSYRSGITFDGPVGRNWEHNYNRRLFVDSAGNVVRMDGAGRADYYLAQQTPSGVTYQAPTGFYTELKQNPDGSFTERDRDGTRFSYSALDAQQIARLTEIRDRNENRIQLVYDAQGQLSQVIEPLGRTIVYRHNAQGRLFEVEDFLGRKIKLFYDSNGDLERVVSPAVTGTPNANDFPSGKTTRYAYSSGFSDVRLNHNLLSITAPNEVAAAGPPRVIATYETDPAHPDVDRVRQLTAGGVNANGVPAGGAISYQYQSLGTAPPDDFDIAVSQTTVTDRNGNRAEYRFNQLGTIVRVREFANRAIRPNDAASFETQAQYNQEGELTQVTRPEGNTIQYVYDDQSQDRLQQGNLREGTRLPDGNRGGDQAFIKTTKTYEPIYNQARTMVEPRGNDPGYVPQNGGPNSAARYTAAFFFDYQEGTDIAGLANRLGISQAEVSQLLSQAGIPMGLGDLNGDGRTNQIGGNVVKAMRPTVNLLPGSNMALIEGGTQQPIVELFTYNDFGQLTSRRDPELNVTLHTYHPENDPDGDGQNLTPGVGAGPFGYLKDEVRDAVSAPGRNSGTSPPPTMIRHQFFYDPAGNVIREIDGRGIETLYAVNQLNQVVRITRAAVVPAVGSGSPAEPLPLTAFGYLENIFYDANDNVIKREVEDRGDTSNTGGFIERTTKFDILDQPIEMGEETSSSETLITRYRYDANGNRTLVIQPEGNAASNRYDERDLLFQATRGALNATPGTLGAPPGPYNPRGGAPSTATYNYDLNRNPIEFVDAADTDGSPNNNSAIAGIGDVTKYRYDGFDRRVTTTDAVGNVTASNYDPASNVVKETRSGRVGRPSPTDNFGTNNVPLSVTEYKFDELSRTFQLDQSLFVAQGVATQRPPNLTEGPLVPGDGKVNNRFEYDRKSRRKFTIDDAINVYRMDYDGADRAIKTIDPEGNTVEPAYDDNNSVIETRETDVSQVAGVPNEIFLTTFFHDSLNRLQRRVDNLGQTADYRYDSRNNLAAMADAKGPVSGASITRRAFPNGPRTVNTINDFGNVTIYFYDGINRRTRQELILTAAGQGDGVNIGADIFGVKTATPTPDTTQGGGDGKITIRSEWDRNSLQRSLTDDNGNQTLYAYDNLNRPLMETKGICVPPMLADSCDPPTTISYAYDPDDNVVRLTDENGSVTQCTFDAINRRITCQITRAAGVVGTTAVSYQYDGLSRLTRATDNNEPTPTDDDSIITYAYDSLSRVIEETQKIGALPARAVSSGWNADNHRIALTYPNNLVVTFSYDGLDRLNTIGDQGAAQSIADYDYIGAGRVAQRRHPINGTRMTYLNDAGNADVGYDGLRRPVQLRHLRSDNSLIVGFTHTYDRTNNKLNEGKLHNSPNNEAYDYDSAYRLTRFNRATGGIAPLHSNWTLDGAGNWRQVDSETRQHSSFNEITQRNSSRVTTTILSDNNGNETDDGTFQFVWDYQNRLRTVTRKLDSARIAVYSYDAAGRRIRKVVGNSSLPDDTTIFYLDGWREIEERNGADTLRQQYVYGVYIDEPLVLDRNLNGDGTAIGPGDQRLYYHQNTLHSVFALTDATGRIVEGYQYDAYGRQTVFEQGTNGIVEFGGDDVITPGGVSAVGNPYMFTGRRLDSEAGLFYYRRRYLNSDQGRFVQRDQAGYDVYLNLYQYASSEPIRRVDPLGLTSEDCIKCAACAALAVACDLGCMQAAGAGGWLGAVLYAGCMAACIQGAPGSPGLVGCTKACLNCGEQFVDWLSRSGSQLAAAFRADQQPTATSPTRPSAPTRDPVPTPAQDDYRWCCCVNYISGRMETVFNPYGGDVASCTAYCKPRGFTNGYSRPCRDIPTELTPAYRSWFEQSIQAQLTAETDVDRAWRRLMDKWKNLP